MDQTILLRAIVCLVRAVCDRATGHCNGGAGLFRHAEFGVKVFHNRVFAGAVQSVDYEAGEPGNDCV